jgi:hypothetical protein
MPSLKSGEVAVRSLNALAKFGLLILVVPKHHVHHTSTTASRHRASAWFILLHTMAGTSIIRDRSPLAVLLDPNTDIPLGERDIRLEDYLNDKIQTATDFESLESLIASVEAQKQQLEDQVSNR